MEVLENGLRLNIGCGRQVLDGWFNVDAVVSPLAPRPPELLADARSIPLPDGCASVLMAIHLFEHLYRWECESTLAEWARLLRAGGRLILEMPDVVKCAQNLISGRASKTPDQLSMWGLYGDPREGDALMTHRWGWTFATIKPLLEAAGFINATPHLTKFHPAGRAHRDFRVEAIKA